MLLGFAFLLWGLFRSVVALPLVSSSSFFSDFSFIFVFLFLAFDVLRIVRLKKELDDDHQLLHYTWNRGTLVNKKMPLPDGKTSNLARNY